MTVTSTITNPMLPESDVAHATQKEAVDTFNSNGFPVASNESWLYWQPDEYKEMLLAPKHVHALEPVIDDVCICIENGVLKTTVTQKGVVVSTDFNSCEAFSELRHGVESSSVSLLNTAQFQQCVVIRISETQSNPLRVKCIGSVSDSGCSVVSKVILVTEKEVKASVTIEHVNTLNDTSVMNTSIETMCYDRSELTLTHCFSQSKSPTFFDPLGVV